MRNFFLLFAWLTFSVPAVAQQSSLTSPVSVGAANTWTAAQTFNGTFVANTNIGAGIYPGFGSNGVGLGWNLAAGNAEAAIVNTASSPNWNFSFYQQTGASAFTRVLTIKDSGGIVLPKLAAAPSAAPGAGFAELFFVAGTNAGSCKLQALAGTSTTPVTIADNIGTGC